MIKNTMQKQQIESAILFDDMAEGYTDAIKSSDYVGPQWLADNFYINDKAEALNILDLGCGNGINANNLIEKYKNIKITGLDISPEMIFEATKLFIYENLYHQSLDDKFTFAENKSFDSIVVLGCLEFVSKIKQCINEISRVLKTDGFVYMSFQVYEEGNKFAPRQSRSGDLLHFAYSKKEVENMLAVNGLKIISFEQQTGYTGIYPCPYFFIKAKKEL